MYLSKLRNIFFLLITFSIGTTFAYGQAELDVPDIEYETFTLSNGLTVVVHEDRKVPMVAINVWYHVGSKNEKVGSIVQKISEKTPHVVAVRYTVSTQTNAGYAAKAARLCPGISISGITTIP